MFSLSNFKIDAIRIEAEAAVIARKWFPLALFATTIQSFPGIGVMIGVAMVAAGVIGHLV